MQRHEISETFKNILVVHSASVFPSYTTLFFWLFLFPNCFDPTHPDLNLSHKVMSFPPTPAYCSDFNLMTCYSAVQKGVALSSKTLENFYQFTWRRSPEEFNSSFSPP